MAPMIISNLPWSLKQEEKLLFLDILIISKQDGSMGQTVYRKPTNTNLYLNDLSHHHKAQKASIMTTLISRAQCIADKEHLPETS